MDFADDARHGIQSKTVLHEALHAATAEQIHKVQMAVIKGEATDAEKALSRQFTRITNALGMDALRIINISRTAPETVLKFGKHQAMAATWAKNIQDSLAAANIHEALAHGFQTPDLQAWMNTVQVSGGETVFDAFVNIMKKLFKIKDGSALEQLMRLTDDLLPAKGTSTKAAPKPKRTDVIVRKKQ